MIAEYTRKDLSNIVNVINDAASKYKGVIPDDCWHEPYMSEHALIKEFNDGVQMFGYSQNSRLVGVMGIQKIEEITLIRHAYTLTHYQGIGIGKSLLQYLFEINKNIIRPINYPAKVPGRGKILKTLTNGKKKKKRKLKSLEMSVLLKGWL